MKKLMTIILLVMLILSGCQTPNYGSEKEDAEVLATSNGIEVATLNGYVIEVTEDNIIKIKVPKRGEMIQKGLKINEEGIFNVALASVKLPTDNLPLSEETNAVLKNLLLNNDISLDLLEETAAPGQNTALKVAQGYIHLEGTDTSIQEVLIENGLAIIDKNEPSIKSYLSKLEKIQTVAQNNLIGVWAIDGFVDLRNTIGGQFTNVVNVDEEEIKTIIKDIKKKGKELGISIFN
ncbi:thermonuclease family protein [Lysinibacillus sphaericus]|uniref:thermonuclease family protein n=1 Tax=Lysinibacillus sphaericus TaxID=1421 RepID=UPI000C1A1657|nr:thermonuclease family protein [Lysinibacillus sphaericus]PIJ98148.1 hypothetical protein CTN02_10425 [Lysinibacillus sphaericus]